MRSAIVEDGVVTNVILGQIDGSLPCADDVAIGWGYDGVEFIAPPVSSPADQISLVEYAAVKRWEKEVGGVTVLIAGEAVPVSTKRGDDRAALHTNYSAITGGLRQDGAAFKFADDIPRAVSNADLMTAIRAALSHVQACFDLEMQIAAAIAAGEINDTASIDAAFAA